MSGSGEKKHDGVEVLLGGIAIIVVVSFIIWFRMRFLVLWPAFAIDLVYYQVLNVLHLVDANGMQDFVYIRDVLQGFNDITEVPLEAWGAVQWDVGSRIRLPVLAVVAGFGMLVYFRMRVNTMSRNFTFRGMKWSKGKKGAAWKKDGDDFRRFQAEGDWRIAITSAYFDPDKNEPNWAISEIPAELARRAGVLKVSAPGTAEKIERVLAAQLGPTWKGIEKAPPHARAIALLAYMNSQRDPKMIKVAGDLAELCLPHQPFPKKELMQMVDPMLQAKPEIIATINKTAKPHAFLATAMVAIVGAGGPLKDWGAKKAGVFAPCTYLWLKGVDRGLWYALNDTGRPTFHPEAQGVMAHFKRERQAGKPLHSPAVAAGVAGIIDVLKKTGVDDIEKHMQMLEENQT